MKNTLVTYCNPIKKKQVFGDFTVIEFFACHNDTAYWICETKEGKKIIISAKKLKNIK